MVTLTQLLQKKFGYSSFRKGQQEIIEDLLRGYDVLAMLPTGGGKSLCYQLPAYLLPGSVLIISPLVSLMEDQVRQLRERGEKRAIAFNSFLETREKWRALEQLDHIEAGHHFVAIRLKFVPAVGSQGIGGHRQAAEADTQRQGTAGNEMLHADSTWGQLITHIRPSLNSPVPLKPDA